MKIGDKVRFLSETGGGRISGFRGKDIVLVEDEDGFEIPTQITDVVLADDSDYSMTHMVQAERNSAKEAAQTAADTRSIKERLADNEVDIPEEDEDPSVTFVPKPKERSGGNLLSVYLAFVPMDYKDITGTKFETYLINDSNYTIRYSYMTAESSSWSLRSEGEIEPNTKIFVEEFDKKDLNELLQVSMQLLAFKRDKNFMLKPAVDVQFRVDGTKFYKLHTFRENDFFETPALLYTVIENDKPVRPLVVDPDRLKEEMYSPQKDRSPKAARTARPQDDMTVAGNMPTAKQEALVKRYESNQSKSRKVKQILNDDKIVVDLHIDQLLDSTVGMSNANILDYQLDVFRQVMEQYKNKKGQKIIFIHGKGEGVLRHAIIHELNYKYKGYPYQDASFREYGYGATQVTIK